MESLPDELLLNILDHLLPEVDHLRQNRCTTWALSRVSKRFHALLLDSRYRDYSFHLGDPALFLRTLSTSPNAAACVKRITWGFDEDEDRGLLSTSLSYEEKAHIVARLQAPGTGSARGLGRRFLRLDTTDHPDYLSATLLLTPRVEKLIIRVPTNWPDANWLDPVIEHSNLLSSLSKVAIYGCRRINSIFPIVTLPSLRKFDLTMTRDESEIEDATPASNNRLSRRLQKEGSAIQNLLLLGTYQDLVALGFLAKSCRSLKSLELDYNASESRKDQVAAYAVLNDLLSQHSTTLEHLRVNDVTWLSPSPVNTILGSFDQLQYLRSLQLNFMSLLPREGVQDILSTLKDLLHNLPDNLMQLTLSIDDDPDYPIKGFSDCLQAIVPTIPTSLPALRKFAVVDWDPLIGGFAYQSDLALFQDIFDKIGVEFVTSAAKIDSNCLNQIFCLDHVELGWSWIQPMAFCGEYFKWTYGIGDAHTIVTVDGCEIEDYEEEDGWVLIDISQENDMVMDQYLTEQPVWYWEELQKERSNAQRGLAMT